MSVIITGTGSYIPRTVTTNDQFNDHDFFNEDGTPLTDDNAVIIRKFKAITGIAERRYIKAEKVTSDIAAFAAEKAIELCLIFTFGWLNHDRARDRE